MSSDSSVVTASGSEAAGEQLLFTDPAEVFDAVHDVIGRKWHLRIVYRLLEEGPMGFSDLKEGLAGVSAKMLSESLSTLEEEGVVDREVVSDQPVRVEYSLTERGRDLEPVVSAVVRWGVDHGRDSDGGADHGGDPSRGRGPDGEGA